MDPALIVAAVLLGSLVVYVLTGGADFGGGVWELFATGPRADRQREALRRAIAPIWEANHVWMILAVVLLFVCFPRAFSAISIALHIPITLMLIGIVLRGSAFAFRSYAAGAERLARRSSTVFAVASVVTPLMLGVTAGAVASGSLRMSAETGQVDTDFFSAWLAPFPFAIGLLTLALCALLAAVYMTVETEDDPELAGDFRRRALIAAVAAGVCAALSAATARAGAPVIYQGLLGASWSLPLQLGTGAAAVGAIAALWKRRYRLARLLAVLQCALIVGGWGLAQYPYVVAPDLTIAATAAPRSVLIPVLIALAIGSVILIPAFWYLYAVFKTRAD